jgi:hypothetical protein
MGFAAFFLEPSSTAIAATHQSVVQRIAVGSLGAADQQITNGVLTLTISGQTGLLSAWSSSSNGITIPLVQEFLWYNASAGNAPNDGTGGSSWGQASASTALYTSAPFPPPPFPHTHTRALASLRAHTHVPATPNTTHALSVQAATTYIFRPNSSTPFPPRAGPADVEIVAGPIVSEARQYMGGGDWLCNVLRIYAPTSSAVESEWTVGAIPIDDSNGKEVVMRFTAGAAWANSSGSPPILWSDSNGLEMQQRVLNRRPSWNSTAWEWEPVATNYYPVTARAFIEEPSSGSRLTLSPDRAQGCASLAVGQIECMLHRRLLVDNFLGNGEAVSAAGPEEMALAC